MDWLLELFMLFELREDDNSGPSTQQSTVAILD